MFAKQSRLFSRIKVALMANPKTIKTRLMIVSDTHSHSPKQSKSSPFPDPMPRCDVFIHAGDMTNTGTFRELEKVAEWISKVDAEVKIVVAGNHDIELDAPFCRAQGTGMFRRAYSFEASHALFTSAEAVASGIAYLNDETRTFTLSSGAAFSVHGSPCQPVFCDWAFNYPHHIDRWSAASPTDTSTTAIPDNVDILVTHGPSLGVLDIVTHTNLHVGCPWLKLALERVRPRLHVCGHIHESRGAGRLEWHSREDVVQRARTGSLEAELRKTAEQTNSKLLQSAFDAKAGELLAASPLEKRLVLLSKNLERQEFGCTKLDVSCGATRSGVEGELEVGRETLVINAAMMSRRMRPTNSPFLVDIDLPLADYDGRQG